MKQISLKNVALYTSIALYSVYIFLVNWTAAAEKTVGMGWAASLLSSLSILVLLSCCAAVGYKFLKDIGLYAKQKWYSLSAVVVLALLAITVQSISIFLPVFIGFAALGGSNKTIARVVSVSLSLLLLLSSIFYVFGLNGGNTVSKPLFGDDSYYSVVVPSLGMSNPNGVMMIFVIIIITTLYTCSTRRQFRYLTFVLLSLAIILSTLTGSTTGLLIGLFAILLMYLAKYGKKTPKRLKKISPWMFAIVTLLTFVLGASFGPASSLPNPVNDTLTTRPYMWNLRIENDSYLNIYGDNDQYISDGSKAGNAMPYALDNMTLYILVKYGIVIYFIFFYLFYMGSKRIKDPELLVFVVVACLLMFVERMYLYSTILIFLQKAIMEYRLLNKPGLKEDLA